MNRNCDRPPHGWYCTRGKDHEGPCAADMIPNYCCQKCGDTIGYIGRTFQYVFAWSPCCGKFQRKRTMSMSAEIKMFVITPLIIITFLLFGLPVVNYYRQDWEHEWSYFNPPVRQSLALKLEVEVSNLIQKNIELENKIKVIEFKLNNPEKVK